MNPDTLAEALETTWQRWPERVALIYGERSVTYAELGEAVLALADAYRAQGLGRGDRIVCSVSNRPEQIIALGAAWVCGAVHVGVDHQITAHELSTVVGLTGARGLVFEPPDDAQDSFEPPHAVRRNHPGIVLIGAGEQRPPVDALALSDLIAPRMRPPEPHGHRSPGPSPQDPAMIFMSSGTTGSPKASVGFHRNLRQRWHRLAGWLKFSSDDVHLVQMPLSHGFGLMMTTAALLTGGRLVLLPHFSAEEALRLISREHVTILNGSPTHFRLILDRWDRARDDLRSLRLSVGTAATFPPSLVHSIWEELGVEFMFMYGSSEGVGVATTDRADILRGSVGRPAPGSVTIVGPDRLPLPPGEIGEIAFSRKVFPVQYWSESGRERINGSASADIKSSDSWWYYSGDHGRLDDEGRLYVFGRLSHQIDRGGLKVDPVEVERALLQCSGVADAAVIGLPNPVLGETVCACVVPVPGQMPSLEQLRIILGHVLTPYKLPEDLCIIDQIPRTEIGKIDLERLRADVTVKMTRQLERQ